MVASEARYKPGEHFEEVAKEPLVNISLTGSTELWLVQWPLNQLQPADFNGKELTLKLHHDGTLGGFESSSGKSYEVVSYAAQEPDATVFLPSQSETKAVGKISRRICLVHYPEPDELAKPGFGNLNLSSQREGSFRKTMSRYSGMSMRHGSSLGIGGISHETLGSVNDDQGKAGNSERKQHRRHEKTGAKSQATFGSSQHSSYASGPGLGSQITNTSLASVPSQGEKSNKKKKMKVEE